MGEAAPVGAFDGATSIWFDIHKDYKAEPVRYLVNAVEAIIAPHIKILPQHRKLYRQNIRTTLTNLFVAYDTAPGSWVAYFAGRAHYKVSTRYNKLGISFVTVQIVNAMVKAGLAEKVNGFIDRTTRNSRASRCRATQLLENMFIDAALLRTYVFREVEAIVLRGPKDGKKHGDNVEYEDTPQTKAWRRDVERINKSLRSANIALDISAEEREELLGRMRYRIDTTRNQLQRVFNETFNFGGRLYGHWVQNMPNEYRPKLRINGNETVELDFSEHHIRLLYAIECGEVPDEDTYELPMLVGKHDKAQWRTKCKMVLNMMINASTPLKAIQAAQQRCNDKGLKTNHKELKWIAEALARKHAPIAKYFGTGAGLMLQRKDSDLAVDILIRLLDQNITAIPLHDSFVVEVQHKEKLLDAMNSAFVDRFKVSAKISEK